MSTHVSMRFALLDNQVIDADDLPIGRIDDLEIDVTGGDPKVTKILMGAQALGERLGGCTGRLMAATAARARAGEGPSKSPAIAIELIDSLQPLVKLSVGLRDLDGIAGLERWLADRLVGRLPGAGDASE